MEIEVRVSPGAGRGDFGESLDGDQPGGAWRKLPGVQEVADLPGLIGQSPLRQTNQGAEAKIFEVEGDDAVYKLFVHKPTGVGRTYKLGILNRKLAILDVMPGTKWDIVTKLHIIDRMGTPSEIIAQDYRGHIAAKQDKMERLAESIEMARLDTESLILHELPRNLFNNDFGAEEPRLLQFDGRFFILGDFRRVNLAYDHAGDLRAIDLIAAEIPPRLAAQIEGFQQFLYAVDAYNKEELASEELDDLDDL